MIAREKGLSGWRCEACGEVEFDAGSARRYGAAGDELVLRDRERQSKEIRRIRRKLGLSQVPSGLDACGSGACEPEFPSLSSLRTAAV
jgi:HTH-type transcriptional regulator/antitoxin MqsA